MSTLYTLVGLPGAGKSTFTRAHSECVVVSLDGIRGELYGDEAIQGCGRYVFELAVRRIEAALIAGHDVIYDATNVTRRRRHAMIRRYPQADHVAVFVSTPLDECIRRNNSRARVVPADYIIATASKLTPPTTDEGFKKIIEI